MDRHHYISDAWWPYDDPTACEDDEQSAGRESTSTLDTVYSGFSDAQTSTSSDSRRFSRAPSLASSCTSYTSSSQPLTNSWLSVGSDLAAGQFTWRQTLKQKQATNRYACSHCDLTFSKKADRSKHVREKCPFFGSEFLCSRCPHISRNEYQADKHRKDYGHEGKCEAVAFSKHALTCSNDGILYRSLKEYLDHFSSSRCILNAFDGNRKHLSRLRTLLCEGRDDENGHSYIFAALVRYCSQHTLTMDACNAIIDALPSAIAQDFAERLEWGCAPNKNNNSAHGRLGYTNFDTMVAEIMTVGINESNCQHSPYIPGVTDHHLNHAPRQKLSTRHPAPMSSMSRDDIDSISIESSVRIRRKHIPINPVNVSRPLPPLPAAVHDHHSTNDMATRATWESPAVRAANSMLRQQCLKTKQTKYEASNDQSSAGIQRGATREKRPRPLGSPGPPESPPHSKIYLRPSLTCTESRAHKGSKTHSPDNSWLENEPSELADWPEFYSLSPPTTARNASFAVESQLDSYQNSESIKQKRQGGEWKSLFNEFVILSDDEDA